MDKRIYSLNLISYVMMQTGIEPDLEINYAKGNGVVYGIFPDCEAVASAIKDYRKDTALHNFLQSYADLREQIKQARGL